jgi:hemerythrin-like domain-containing protein
MADTKKEILALLREHEAIRAHMKFLTRALKKLTAQSHEGTAADLKERITLYRWSLYDFREAVHRHIEMDDRIFNVLVNQGVSTEMDRGHQEITRRLDDIIDLAENAVYNTLSLPELNKSAEDIKEAVKALCDICQAHIATEDSILKPAFEAA